ncbi:hypothetical protein BHC44_08120 [Snodgrassella alvi]|jgi:type II secretory pathway pseudopilin PulG|uniref:DUF1090 domain-containing protein n=1 Tax=Snodgrassella alvi TaxID=1196083 RepID=A0A2N9XZ03_9NEIS|nr:DUF1090 domain-containing protein [Snodgrassella alvi]PIT52194.1 hypothetical protein BHC44_08120 [Snodgrassella alvi]PIT56152.1 hypothetical protein BHC49_05325 [Snodgrassella alvi]
MNYSRTLEGTLLALALSATFSAIAADNWQTCKEKQQQIEKQLQYARANNNQKQINRLNIQKTDIAQNCSNEDLRQKYTQKIDKLTNKINENQRKLDKAQAKGDIDKVTDLQNKLNENKAKLQQAKQNFARFEQAAKQ